MLAVRGLEVDYGPIPAVCGVDLDVHEGEIVALIGANGAGKTTTVRAIAGLLPFRGEIRFDGHKLQPDRAELNVGAGMALVPEGRGILGGMSTEENLLMGIYCRSDRKRALADIEEVLDRFPILKERRRLSASVLSGGEQQILAIARALLSQPRLLLLDEPSLGLAPKTSNSVFALINNLRRDGLTVLLVEQKARQSLQLGDRAYLLENGLVVASGKAKELADDPLVKAAFLGHTGRPSAGPSDPALIQP
jgi:branched-chain amino acid transport system ATP-binding protein